MLDRFGQDVPGFNIKGQKKINTTLGGCISLIWFTIIIMYGLSKFVPITKRQNPSFSEFNQVDYFGGDHELHLHD